MIVRNPKTLTCPFCDIKTDYAVVPGEDEGETARKLEKIELEYPSRAKYCADEDLIYIHDSVPTLAT